MKSTEVDTVSASSEFKEFARRENQRFSQKLKLMLR